jgi:hypothetical protein
MPCSMGSPSANRRSTGPLGAVLALALVAALLLVAAELSTIVAVDVPGESCEVINDADPAIADRCALSGWERHGGALLLLALVAGAAGYAARNGDNPLAGGVLLADGAVVLGLTLIGDLPDTNETGAIGLNFEGATAQAGLGFYLELTAGVLCVLAGVLALARARRDASLRSGAQAA